MEFIDRLAQELVYVRFEQRNDDDRHYQYAICLLNIGLNP